MEDALRDMLFSNDLPVHPAIVHFPLVLAVLAPLVLGWLAWRTYRGAGTRVAWGLALGLQLAVIAGGLVALGTGARERERVEATVPAWPLEMHERRATTFVIAAGALLVIVGAAAVAPRTGRLLAPLAIVVACGVAALGLSAGHAGGELVFRHGAAQVGR